VLAAAPMTGLRVPEPQVISENFFVGSPKTRSGEIGVEDNLFL
jgi:hypothetical protein